MVILLAASATVLVGLGYWIWCCKPKKDREADGTLFDKEKK